MQAPKTLLRQTRERLELSQTRAAELCGVSLSSWEKWEAGAEMKPHVLAGVLLMLGADAATALKAARSLL